MAKKNKNDPMVQLFFTIRSSELGFNSRIEIPKETLKQIQNGCEKTTKRIARKNRLQEMHLPLQSE